MWSTTTFNQKRVDLSGHAQKEDKQALLERAKRERAARAAVIVQTNTCQKIQRWWHDIQVRRKTNNDLRSWFDLEFSQLQLESVTDAINQYVRCVRLLFLFFTSTLGEDLKRLEKLSEYTILLSVQNEDQMAESLLNTAMNSYQHAYHMFLMCLFVLHYYVEESGANAPSPSCMSFHSWKRIVRSKSAIFSSNFLSQKTTSIILQSSMSPIKHHSTFKQLFKCLLIIVEGRMWNRQANEHDGRNRQWSSLMNLLSRKNTFLSLYRLVSVLILWKDCREYISEFIRFLAIWMKLAIGSTMLVRAKEMTAYQKPPADHHQIIYFILNYLWSVPLLFSVECPFTSVDHRWLEVVFACLAEIFPLANSMASKTRPLLCMTPVTKEQIIPLIPVTSITHVRIAFPAIAGILSNFVLAVEKIDIESASLGFQCLYFHLLSQLLYFVSSDVLASGLVSNTSGDNDDDLAPHANPLSIIALSPLLIPVKDNSSITFFKKLPFKLCSDRSIITIQDLIFISPLKRENSDHRKLASLLRLYRINSSSHGNTEALLKSFHFISNSNPDYISILCNYLCALAISFPKLQPLSSFTFTTPILHALWRWLEILIDCPLSQYKSSASSSSIFNTVTNQDPHHTAVNKWRFTILSSYLSDSKVFYVFLCWILAYTPFLFTSDDEEFVSNHCPFPDMRNLQQFSKLMKLIIFDLLWDARYTSSTSNYPLLQPALRVLRELFQRDSRTSYMTFVPDNNPSARNFSTGLGTAEFAQNSHWLILEKDDKEWDSTWKRWISGNANSSDEQDNKASAAASRVPIILRAISFVIPFEDRVKLFRAKMTSSLSHSHVSAELQVRRSHIVNDGLSAVDALGGQFKQKVRVKFINDEGYLEAGVDLGGPFKEFLEVLCKSIFRLDYGLFLVTPDGLFYPNPQPSDAIFPDFQVWMRNCGKIIGKALAEGILIDVPFARFFLGQWIGHPGNLYDLQEYDAELYKNVMMVKKYLGDVSDLGLTFAVNEERLGGETRVVELIPNGFAHVLKHHYPTYMHIRVCLLLGSDITVTENNRISYVYYLADYYLNQRLRSSVAAFLDGLGEIVSLNDLKLFEANELRVVLSGSVRPIDVEDWKAHTIYDQCKANDKTVVRFWRCVERMTDPDRRALLRFVTANSRPPLMGFAYLHPAFTIRLVDSDSNNGSNSSIVRSLHSFFSSTFSKPKVGMMPMAATCFNLLKLPRGDSETHLEEKLHLAIHTTTGFDRA